MVAVLDLVVVPANRDLPDARRHRPSQPEENQLF
jgi:hypothetical protein